MYKVYFALLALIAIATVSASVASRQMVIAQVETDTPAHFVLSNRASQTTILPFKILLKQNNLDVLEEIFWEVSDPKSDAYGKFMTKNEIDMLTGASDETVKAVTQWLFASGLTKFDFMVSADYIQVRTTVNKIEKLLNAQFYDYVSASTGNLRTRINGRAYIPFDLAEHIDFIVGLSEFIEDPKMNIQTIPGAKKPVRANARKAADLTITPAVIKNYYGVPASQVATNDANYQSIAAFGDYFSMGALNYFGKTYKISNVRVNRQGPNCFNENCDQMESDLDIQYSTAMGLNVSTLFINHANGEWVLDWAIQIADASPLPMITSLSYGFSEIEQCVLTNECTTVGYSNLQYVERSNVAFQKLGLMGMSILVSAGDDGAPSFFYASGNCPLDASKYCPLGGCASSSTQCPSVTISYAANNTVCVFPGGTGNPTCGNILNQEGSAALNQFISANKKCKVSIEQDSQQNYHIHSNCACSSLNTITHSGFKVSGYTYSESNGAMFYPDFPTSSPYVTSVGATQILSMSQPEIVCSISTGAIITGGGGFSNVQPQPAYQEPSVNNYLQQNVNLPPAGTYNTSGRAYPDITFVGHAYSIAYTGSDSDTCPCQLGNVDGTSCSSPTLAGLFSLVNDKLLNAGKSQLGFLNPMLYQAQENQPSVFHDITTGDISCNRAYCCEYGFHATQGYDAASGLGSINFPQFQNYVLSLK
ncbi:peptidase S8 and S53 domain-containing protein [Heterostelium album PN500]|uniref:Peptidase S8 and S53 domain-containing protein n=1 Tax=Heterostelium pallidum (strain ATCC 26659 / Pp 5 / PN500) TaxID=670386 RepID=D3BLS3_HETP5|nr:peptidase S8 and S53 domain-containing protein [Heterostelium album PN500]EFA77524.1 peptidase S8 and S53 domain-containing protein [Heterostelium album PN500]|eukprot:XP_020429652.1 peptidase S8 and S53 domain-containing protein [Heterostelium album PN500]